MWNNIQVLALAITEEMPLLYIMLKIQEWQNDHEDNFKDDYHSSSYDHDWLGHHELMINIGMDKYSLSRIKDPWQSQVQEKQSWHQGKQTKSFFPACLYFS